MILSQKRMEELKEAAQPLMKFLSTLHPHVQVVVEDNRVELFESSAVFTSNEFLKD